MLNTNQLVLRREEAKELVEELQDAIGRLKEAAGEGWWRCRRTSGPVRVVAASMRRVTSAKLRTAGHVSTSWPRQIRGSFYKTDWIESRSPVRPR